MSTDTPPGYPFTINGRPASSSVQAPTQPQLLTDAGFEPPDDFVLIERTATGTRVVSSDDVIQLGNPPVEFFAFASGVGYELTLNGHSIWWGHDKIEIREIRTLGNVADDQDLIWEREDGNVEVVPLEGKFSLGSKRVEHLITKKRPVKPEYEYFVDSVEYRTEHAELTGAQIIARIPNWNPANSLVLEGQGSEPDEMIRPSTIVIFKGRPMPARFIIVPPATFGSA